MKALLKYAFLLCLLLSVQQLSAQWRLIMEMVVTDEGRKLPGAEIKVYKNGSLIETVLTDGKGRADIPMDPNADYSIEIGGNKGLIKKKLAVNTKNVPPEIGSGDITYPAEVEIFKKIDGLDLSILNKPIGKIQYDDEYGDFGADRQYTKQVKKALDDLKNDFLVRKAADEAAAKQAQKEYDAIIKVADKAFAEENWELAESEYKKAQAVLPIETYPSFQLAELETKLIKIRADGKKYDEAISKADAAVAAKNYETAIAEYKRASGYKPNEAYPKDKVKEVQGILANAAKVEQSYLAAIEKGDNSLKINDLKTAKTAFQEASGLKPDESYPKNKIAEIDDILAKQQAKESEYNDAIKSADDALAAKDYETAKSNYQKALGIKPTETYPKDQIGRVEALMAKAAKLEQDYLAAIEKGDQALQANQYQEAKTAFESASSLKPDESYPKDKIKEIKDFIAQNQAKEKQYADQIAAADKALAAKKYEDAKTAYNEASGIKPEENYPKEKISEIDGILADLAKQEEGYKAAIAKGDQALAGEDFEGAKAAYNEALGLKPDEQYPKDKLAEIDTIVLKNQQTEESYKTAIQNGDDALANKDYDNAKKFYNEASSIKSDEQYPKDKLAEIDGILAAEAEKEQNYKDAIAEGDAAMKGEQLEDAKAAYEKALSIKADETYPKDQIAKIDQQLADNQQKEADYQAAIKEGDDAFAAAEYEKAKSAFERASSIKSSEEYPKNKISEIDGLLANLKEQEENYNNAIKKGDDAFSSEQWEEAKTAYQEALGIKEDDYPKGKITEIDTKLAELAAAEEQAAKLEADYQAAITEGDQLAADKKYEDAIAAYNKALGLKPDEKYPADKVSEIQAEIDRLAAQEAENARLAEIQQKYEEAIAKADASLGKEDYEAAKSDYQAALAIKSDETYPQSKIDEIDGILANAAEQDQKYQDAIASADQLFSDEKWEEAKGKYTEATAIKSEEQYPIDKIKEIDDKLAAIAAEQEEIRLQNEKQAELDQQYQDLIQEADGLVGEEKYDEAIAKYQEALTVKNEQYPKDKITEIEAKKVELADQAAATAAAAEQAKIDEQYQALVTEADALFGDAKYDDATAKYQEALTVKDEQYPKDKITEIEAKKVELADQAAAEAAAAEQAKIDEQYQVLVAEADGLFGEAKYDDATAKYQEALTVKDEQYPKDKITEIEAKKLELADQAAAEAAAAEQAKIDAQYQALVTEADVLFGDAKYDDATSKYQEALTVKDEQYPKDKITEIETKKLELADQAAAEAAAAEQAKIDTQYQTIITEADGLLTEEKYEEAKAKYNEALAVKDDQYPKDKINEIDLKLSDLADKAAAAEEQAQIDALYTSLIAEADAFLAAEKYEEAKAKYNESIGIKEEQYPKDKIAEIDGIVASIADAAAAEKAAAEQKYQDLISEADALLVEKNYDASKSKYEEALTVKDEQYPKDKIIEIENALKDRAAAAAAAAELAKKEEQYLVMITEADGLLASKDYETAKAKYQEALQLKDDQYPKDKIAEIDTALQAMADAAKAEELKAITDRYNAAMEEGRSYAADKKYNAAIASFESAARTKPTETAPQEEIDKIKTIQAELIAAEEAIKLKQAKEEQDEADYQSAITDGDQKYTEADYRAAETAYEKALSIKPAETYPQDQLAKIQAFFDAKEAERLAADKEKAEAARKEQAYASIIQRGDQAFVDKKYQIAKKDFEKALGMKPDENYPKEQLKIINELIEEERLAELERKKELDKPITIQKGPKASITDDAEREIERIYKEMWEKRYSNKNMFVQEKTEVLNRLNKESLEKEEEKRQNAIELIEQISIDISENPYLSNDLNLQNYETIKETEIDLRQQQEELEREAERRRNNNNMDNEGQATDIHEYNKQREVELAEGKKEVIQNEHDEMKITAEARTKRQVDRAKVVEEEFVQKEKEVMDFNMRLAREAFDANQDRQEVTEAAINKNFLEYRTSDEGRIVEATNKLEQDREEFNTAQIEENKEAESKRNEKQEELDDQGEEIYNFSQENAESFKNNQLMVEEKEKAVKEETEALSEKAESRIQANSKEEFYKGEKKIRQDQKASDYPQGVTEEIIENQNNSTTIRRIVVEGTQTDVYEKTLYSWGGIFYTKNGNNITKEIWDEESK